ncbi:hypothetical protein [Fusobacterium gastrosuis]|uniref:hypothetical protein n=1 Tax=Fusobacterium gastrosuis TaxID=1755100 RepID=UPI002977A7D0|nr:hypothetical protein [Fusobacteriaceae bacterium]MDY5713464.1 hypothetical protein [Fusobacterium gastrosuis]
MVQINITDTSIEIKGHTATSVCNAVSAVAQYMCSNLELDFYKCEYGYLKATFKDSYISKLLLKNFVRFITDLNYTGIYLIDERGMNEKNSINYRA